MLFKFGNHKLDESTIIFNMGSAQSCPSNGKHLCRVKNNGLKCYAEKSEIIYKEHILNSRNQQTLYWLNKDEYTITQDICRSIRRRKRLTKWFRFNESGDFWNQECVDKLSCISEFLYKNLNVITYGYTARVDLDFSKVHFLFKGSGYDIPGSTGRTDVFLKNDIIPDTHFLCSGDCGTKCTVCMVRNKTNVAFKFH